MGWPYIRVLIKALRPILIGTSQKLTLRILNDLISVDFTSEMNCTVTVARMSHRKWRETKQQLIWWPDLDLLGCCLVYLLFLGDIRATVTVHVHTVVMSHVDNPDMKSRSIPQCSKSWRKLQVKSTRRRRLTPMGRRDGRVNENLP